MTSIASFLVRACWVVMLGVIATACSTSDEPVTDDAWASEAVDFFEELSLTHNEGDYYGVLDFYDNSAAIDRARGTLRGPVVVADRLRWNSGDLNHTVLDVNIDADGALNLVRWLSNDELGAVVSVLRGGVIHHQTVFDLGANLTRGLRTTQGVVSRYEDMYFAYAEAWSRDRNDLDALYAPAAVAHDSLSGIDATGLDAIGASWPRGVTVSATETTGRDIPAPAVFLGPSEYGEDPRSAVGMYQVAGEDGCQHQLAVHWLLDDGLIINERRYHDVESYVRCAPEREPIGWWSGLDSPQPRDSVVTGQFATPSGRVIQIYNGSERLEHLLEAAIRRFGEAGLAEPVLDSVTYEPSRACADRSGRVLEADGQRRVFICIYESDLCPNLRSCDVPSSSSRFATLHELGHVWMLDNVDREIQSELLSLSGRTTWLGTDVLWVDRGVEYAADVVAWGLLEEEVDMVRIRRPGRDELAAAFCLLTGSSPLRPGSICAEG
jgi:hypothetical protein